MDRRRVLPAVVEGAKDPSMAPREGRGMENQVFSRQGGQHQSKPQARRPHRSKVRVGLHAKQCSHLTITHQDEKAPTGFPANQSWCTPETLCTFLTS